MIRLMLLLNLFTEYLRIQYRKALPSWLKYLKESLFDCSSVLDLGCGYNSPIQYCKVQFSVGVDMFGPYLEQSQKKIIHNEYVKSDLKTVEFKPKSFDAVLCVEVIEHLTKEDGYKLIEKMGGWAKKKIIITTPNSYIWQDGFDNNPLQAHKSGWNTEELKNLGFKVYGMNGLKGLKGYKGEIKFKPSSLWNRISQLSQIITYRHPKLAFQLFAVKLINKDNVNLKKVFRCYEKSVHNNS